jgi:hypothetical protein
MGKLTEKEVATAYQIAFFAPKYKAPEKKKIQRIMDKDSEPENENNKSEHPPKKLDKLIALIANQMDLQTRTYQ